MKPARTFDVVVIGGGHAGCEAANAAARMGKKTALLTHDRNRLAYMSCNPAMGGLAKGQLIREVDALGGLIGRVTDRVMIQFRMLNTRKGPAVRSPRAQCDREAYSVEMLREMQTVPNLEIVEDEAVEILSETAGDSKKAAAVKTASGQVLGAGAIVVTAGTFLRGLIHEGLERFSGGRRGEASAEKLTASIKALGIKSGRLKTGTPPRVDGTTVDYSKCQRQEGDETIAPFSFSNETVEIDQVPCWITWTNAATHDAILGGIDRSPLYSGVIKGIGPRYCPSIEDKVVKFPDKERHQVFIEPEGRDTDEVYLNGIATSMPLDVQDAIVRSIPGLEDARVTQYGYAIEYDFFPPTQLRPNLESKLVAGLFFAGQVNGTSGYEEAAAQGLLAGANAALSLEGRDALVLTRDEAYAAVLVDDLVTLGTEEPYRMFTSRAEYRLLLRADNADRRLAGHGHALGLVPDETFAVLQKREKRIIETVEYLENHRFQGDTLAQILRRPENSFADVAALDENLDSAAGDGKLAEQVEIEVKYAGYIKRQKTLVDKFKKLESRLIPDWVDYERITTLRREAREKLGRVRPRSVGQAARISGVNPSDVSIIMVHIAGGRNA